MKNLVYFSILFSLVFWLDGCDQKPAIEPSGKTIKVGIIAPFSGSDHAKGKEGLKGMEDRYSIAALSSRWRSHRVGCGK